MGLNIGLTDVEKMSNAELTAAIDIITAYRNQYCKQNEVDFTPEAAPTIVHTSLPPATPSLPAATPIVATPIFPPPAPGLDLDSSGLPWDGRIHSDKRTKVAEGTWKVKRNTPPELVASVLREQQIAMGQTNVAPAVPSPMSPPPATVFAQPAPVPGVDVPFTPATYPTMNMPVPSAPFVASVEPPVAQAPIIPPPSAGAAPVASPNSPATFERLMAVIAPAFAQGLVNQETISKAVNSVGLPSLPMLAHRPDLVSTVAIALGLTL